MIKHFGITVAHCKCFIFNNLILCDSKFDILLFKFHNFSSVEVPTEKRVKRWGISMEEVMLDPTGNTFIVRFIG